MKTKFFILLLLLSNIAYSQKFKNSDYFIEWGGRYGSALHHPKSYSYLDKLYFGSIEIRFGKQTNGQNNWERSINFPIMGLCLRYTDYADYTDPVAVWKAQEKIMGKSIAFFGYLQGPVIRYKWFVWHYQIGMGAAYFTQIYNEKTNPQNGLISVHVTPYINFQTGFDFKLNKAIDLTLNGNFTHSSNAALQFPNWGLNETQGIFGIRYHLNGEIKKIVLDSVKKFSPSNSLFFTIDPGYLWARYDDYYYLKIGASLGYMRHVLPAINVGAAFEYTLSHRLHASKEAATGDHPAEDSEGNYVADFPKQSINAALYTFGELSFGRFSFHIGIGGYILKAPGKAIDADLSQNSTYSHNSGTLTYNPWLYEKVGFRIALGKQQRHFAGASIRAHFPVADYIAFTYGYKFFQFKDVKKRNNT